MKIAWSGLADEGYWNLIAQYCLPSWEQLPGDKFIIHDSNKINITGAKIIDLETVLDKTCSFLQDPRTVRKSTNFWKKMQSQVWAFRNLKDYDYIILLDTDIEVINFNEEKLYNEIKNFSKSNMLWGCGTSQTDKHDSGFIILNPNCKDTEILINTYENLWNSGKIFDLHRPYDGDAVESLFAEYPRYKIRNTDCERGFHYYDTGFLHYGSKTPKELRKNMTATEIFDDIISIALSKTNTK